MQIKRRPNLAAFRHGPWAIAGGGNFVVAQMPPLGHAAAPAAPRLEIDRTAGATKLVSFAVKDLPKVAAAQHGEIAYATDCRDPEKSENDGSGCLVTVNGRVIWAAVWSRRAVTR